MSEFVKSCDLNEEGRKMKVLIVVDMQNDFIDGALGTEEAVKIVPNVKKKIEEYEKNGSFIIFTQDTHGENYLDTSEGKRLPIPHCIKDTHGWEIADGLNANNHEIILKDTFGYWIWDGYSFENCESIEIVGLCTDICVVTNALSIKTYFPETPIKVDASCCAGTTPELHKAALEVMKSCQIDIVGE